MGTADTLIDPQSGRGFLLHENQILRVEDVLGEQVADLYCVSLDDPSDSLSSGRSIDYNESILFTSGNILYSTSGRPMFEILKDTCGRHDFLVTPCSQQMFTMMSGSQAAHRSCLANLVSAFDSLGLPRFSIGTTFNIFMNVQFQADGKITVKTPLSKAGDIVEFRALRDLYVGLTACSDEGSNGGSCKPVSYSIL